MRRQTALFFPTQAPDELLYSLIARYSKMSGGLPPREVMWQLFQSPNAAATWDLPCRLRDLARLLDVPVESLVDKHTLFPFYANTLPARRAKLLRRWMESDDMTGRIHMAIGASASVVPRTQYLRYCPDCAKQDAADWGSPVWHRVHQCPGVVWCPAHHHPLWLSSVPLSATRSHKHATVTLRAVLADSPGQPLVVDDIDLAERIALRSRELLDGKGPAGPDAWQRAHREQCDRAGFVTAGDRIRICLLREAVDPQTLAFWSKLGVRTDIQNDTHWLFTLLRKPRKAAHPLLHLLAEAFLREVPSATDSRGSIGRIKSAARSTCATDRKRVEADRIKWMDLARRLPGAGVKHCREKEPALFARLYRHSRSWLQQWNADHLPHRRAGGKPRVDWASEDGRLLALCYAARLRLLQVPRRVAQTALLRALAPAGVHPSQLAKLPRLREALRVLSETPEQFLRRRLHQALKRCIARGDGLPRDWELLRAANVHWPWTAAAFTAAREILMRYAGPELAAPASSLDPELHEDQRMASGQ